VSRWVLKFCDPNHISGMDEARNFKFGTNIDHPNRLTKRKLGQRESKKSRELLLKFWDPLHISGTRKVRNYKFGKHIAHEGSNEKNAKLGPVGSGRVHVAYFLNFETPSIFREWLKLETSNLARKLITRSH